MNRADERIERVLAGLRQTSPAADLDRRITEAVEKRLAAAGAGSASFRLRGSATGLVPKLAFSAVSAAALLCLAVGVRDAHHRTSDAAATAHTTAFQRASPARVEPAATAAVVQGPSIKQAVSRKRRLSVSAARARRPETPLAARVRANRPAPPMPLTTQEKLLLQLAREGDPQEIAMLNPDVRAQQERERKVEFDKFFENTERRR